MPNVTDRYLEELEANVVELASEKVLLEGRIGELIANSIERNSNYERELQEQVEVLAEMIQENSDLDSQRRFLLQVLFAIMVCESGDAEQLRDIAAVAVRPWIADSLEIEVN